MRRERRVILEALAEVADAAPIRWNELERSVSTPDVVSRLRVIAGIAEVHRTADGVDRDEETTRSTDTPPASVPKTWHTLTIRGRLGEGASSDVFRAFDPTLEREVALKLFKEPLHPGAWRRVLDEARALASVEHAHVARVHGAEYSDGRVGLWMELVRGRTVERLLVEQGPFGTREAALLGQDICHALAAVHARGVTHGDVKAQNVIREDGGRMVLVDFGSSRKLASAGSRLTGTPMYLAPEILAGGPPTVAGDIYALGVLLFHVLTGRFPYDVRSIDELKAAHESGARASLSDFRADVLPLMVRVIETATDPDPARRFASAGAMEAALAPVLGQLPSPVPTPSRWSRAGRIATLFSVLSATLLISLAHQSGSSRVTPARGFVAVVPFRTIGVDAGDEHLGEMLADEVTTYLSSVSGLQLVSGAAVRRVRNEIPDGDAGLCHKVASTIVTGTLIASGEVLRASVEMTDCATSEQLWADSFYAPRSEFVRLQRHVARGVVYAVKGRLTQDDAFRLQPNMTDNAYEAYIRGRYLWNKRTPADLSASIEWFKRAISIDPDAARPHAGLADAYMLSGLYGVMPRAEAARLGEAAARRALELDPTLAEAHTALAGVQHERWDLAAAGASYRRAIAHNPNYAPAHHWYAVYLAQAARFDEARREINYAAALEPFSPTIATARGVVLYVAGDFAGAIAEYQRVLATDPDFAAAHSALGEAYIAAGQFTEALQSLRRARQLSPAGDDRGIEAYALAASGDEDGARRLLAAVEAGRSEAGATDVAAAYALLGEAERAERWLRRAQREKDRAFLYARVEPRYEAVRRLAAFTELSAVLTFDGGAEGDAR